MDCILPYRRVIADACESLFQVRLYVVSMVRPVILVLGAVPAVAAAAIAVSLLLQPAIPFSAAVPEDNIEIEYTIHNLRVVSFGVTERVGADRTQILTIQRDGDIRLIVTEDGFPQPTVESFLTEPEMIRLVALVKETGFMALPEDTFSIRDDVTQYVRHTVKVTLNGAVTRVTWPEQDATDEFIPPILTHVQTKLGEVLERVR